MLILKSMQPPWKFAVCYIEKLIVNVCNSTIRAAIEKKLE